MTAYWPFIVIGIFTGGLYGLAAMGMVLTYKTVGVFNFAYGAIAMFCAFTYWQLHDQWGISAWLAMPILFLVVAPVIGVILEGLFRPLSGAAIEVVIVVSLGVLAALSAAAGLIWPQDEHLQAIFPISTFRLGSTLHVGYDQLGTLLISLSMAAVLWGLLRHTRFGTQTRAVVDNPDLSDMIGVHGDNVRRVAWILSSVFAALVGILISPSQGLDVNQLVLVVIYAFAPAVLGILFGLPAAYLGGLGLGIAVSIMSKWSNSGTVSNLEAALPYLLLFILLVAFGTRLKTAGSGAVAQRLSALRSAETVRRLRWSVGSLRIERGLAVGLGGFVLALLVPMAFPGPNLDFLTQGFIYAVIALTLVVLTGWAGQISLAQFSFVGVGAFTAGHLAGAHGQHFLFAVVMGMLFATPLGIIVGLVSLRLSGLYLALATLAFALVMDNVVFNRSDVSGGQTGITVPRPHFFGMSFTGRAAMYELAVVVFALVAIVAYALRQGPIGRRLHIVRDSPLAASTLGVNLTVTKIVVFVVGAMVAALGGSLYGAWQQAITPQDFMWSASLALLLVVVLGGRSLISGAVIAGVVYVIPLLPQIPTKIKELIPLLVALGVIGLAQEPEGTVALARRQTRYVLGVLRPLPRRRPRERPDAEPGVRVPTGKVVPGHVR
jgi:branched-chain amino acid transport system permease protein